MIIQNSGCGMLKAITDSNLEGVRCVCHDASTALKCGLKNKAFDRLKGKNLEKLFKKYTFTFWISKSSNNCRFILFC